MIYAISGTLCYKSSETIRIDNNGVEWELFVASRSVDSFGNIGDKIRALCWLLHREDQMRLFGFVDEPERAVFLELLKVDGIGPKQAIKILGGISSTELGAALENEDYARLELVPGLGKKTAQKLVFSLRGKLPKLDSESIISEPKHNDIIKALLDMGYDKRKVLAALKKLDKNIQPDLPDREQELFRSVIVELSST